MLTSYGSFILGGLKFTICLDGYGLYVVTDASFDFSIANTAKNHIEHHGETI